MRTMDHSFENAAQIDEGAECSVVREQPDRLAQFLSIRGIKPPVDRAQFTERDLSSRGGLANFRNPTILGSDENVSVNMIGPLADRLNGKLFLVSTNGTDLRL